MTTKRFLIAVIAVLTMSFSASANVSNFVTNDTQNDKGQTVERTICESSNNILTPYQKIEFRYNENGQITEKETLKWDSMDNKWINYELTEYDYTQNPMKVNIKKWNNKKQIYK